MNMVATGHAVLFGFWNKLAKHLGRSPFHMRSASLAAPSLLRLEPSLDIRVQAFMRTVLVRTPRVAFGACRFAPGETVAAPIPLLTPLRRMVRGCPSCAAHSCFAWKPRVGLPWRTRSSGRWSTGPSARRTGSPRKANPGGFQAKQECVAQEGQPWSIQRSGVSSGTGAATVSPGAKRDAPKATRRVRTRTVRINAWTRMSRLGSKRSKDCAAHRTQVFSRSSPVSQGRRQ